MDIALFIIGCWMIFFGLIVNVIDGGIKAAFFFKAIPFFAGLYVMYYAAKAMGWL